MIHSGASASDRYRPDVDGLRAVSILAVVGYHANLPWVPGGFMGVDVFFVISGYLITRLLRTELQRKGRIDFAAFWARRVRRLLPAATVVLLATIIASMFLLSPALGEVQSVAKSAIATLLIGANFWFLRFSRDYFAATGGEQPLLHSWSLSVEEQFYLIWPALMFIGWRIGSRHGRPLLAVFTAVAIVALGSLVFAATVSFKSTAYAFYLMPARAWELGAGAMLALLSFPIRLPAGLASALAAIGMLLIIVACSLAETAAEFPVPLASIPVLGAALVIGGGTAAPGCIVTRLLSARGMVTIGVASYALYLWHWPILTIARVQTLGELDLARDLLLVVLSVALALLTLRYVERPLRFSVAKDAAPRKVLLAGATVTLALLCTSGAIGWLAKTSPVPADHLAAKLARSDFPAMQAECHASEWSRADQNAACLAEAGQRRIVIWGDSHADHWVPALTAWAGGLEDAPAVEQWTLDACPPLFHATPTAVLTSRRTGYDQCRLFNDRVRQRLHEAPPGERLGIVMASNWWYRTGDVAWKPDEPAHSFDLAAVGEHESLKALARHLRSSMQEITAAGYRVIVVLQSPVLDYPAPQCVLRRGAENCGITLAAHYVRAGKVNSVIREVVAEVAQAEVLDPARLVCDNEVCPALVGNAVAYTDRDHLAASVVRSLAPQVAEALQVLVGDGNEAQVSPRH